MIEQWGTEILEVSHSTAQESANALANLEAALAEHHRNIDVFIEVLDSAATTDVCRSNSSRSFEVRKIIDARTAVRAKYPGVRVITFWQDRCSHPTPTTHHPYARY